MWVLVCLRFFDDTSSQFNPPLLLFLSISFFFVCATLCLVNLLWLLSLSLSFHSQMHLMRGEADVPAVDPRPLYAIGPGLTGLVPATEGAVPVYQPGFPDLPPGAFPTPLPIREEDLSYAYIGSY